RSPSRRSPPDCASTRVTATGDRGWSGQSDTVLCRFPSTGRRYLCTGDPRSSRPSARPQPPPLVFSTTPVTAVLPTSDGGTVGPASYRRARSCWRDGRVPTVRLVAVAIAPRARGFRRARRLRTSFVAKGDCDDHNPTHPRPLASAE